MKKIWAGVLAILLFPAAVGAQQKNNLDTWTYSDEYARKIIGFMTDQKLRGREAGTPENRVAMKYIVNEFKDAGCDVHLQKITSERLAEVIGEPKEGKIYPNRMTNVIARIEGKEKNKYIVVGAHYDHLGYKEGIGIHPGADDNASGIVALLSLARMMESRLPEPQFTILFCAWDGEEKGLLGSKYFVGRWFAEGQLADSICCYMNFDMVGRTATPDFPAVTFAWNDNYPYLKEYCEESAELTNGKYGKLNVIYDRRSGDGKGGSDYAPFSARNIPFVAWMEDSMHEDYHKPGDTPDKIHWDKLHKTVMLAYEVLCRIVY